MLPVPSKLTPPIVLPVANAVAVEALPVKAPVNVVADTEDADRLFVVSLKLKVESVPMNPVESKYGT